MAQDNTKLRVAIAGCHRMLLHKMTSHNLAGAFRAVSETEIVGVFDYGEETREEFASFWQEAWGEIASYGDYGRLLEETRPDILCIATRQTMHADQIEAAAQAGVRGILCDKPLATSLEEMDRIVQACNNVPLAFALDRRWTESYRRLRSEIAAGVIGSVTSLVAYGLPNTINHGCHWYDAILGLLDDPEPVWVSGLIDDVSGDPPDSRRHLDPPGRAQVGMDNGVVVYITPAGSQGASFDLQGEKGRLSICKDGAEAYLWEEGSNEPRPLPLPSADEDWPAGPGMVRDLQQAVRSGGRTACDIEHARRATEIGFGIHISSNNGGAKTSLPAVERSLQVESFPWGNEKDG